MSKRVKYRLEDVNLMIQRQLQHSSIKKASLTDFEATKNSTAIELTALCGIINTNIDQIETFIKHNKFQDGHISSQEIIAFNASLMHMTDSLLMMIWVTIKKSSAAEAAEQTRISSDQVAYKTGIKQLLSLKYKWVLAYAQLIYAQARLVGKTVKDHDIFALATTLSSILSSFRMPYMMHKTALFKLNESDRKSLHLSEQFMKQAGKLMKSKKYREVLLQVTHQISFESNSVISPKKNKMLKTEPGVTKVIKVMGNSEKAASEPIKKAPASTRPTAENVVLSEVKTKPLIINNAKGKKLKNIKHKKNSTTLRS